MTIYEHANFLRNFLNFKRQFVDYWKELHKQIPCAPGVRNAALDSRKDIHLEF